MSEEEIQRLRQRIDVVDQRIQELLAQRTGLALTLGRLKAELTVPIRQPQREEELLMARSRAAEMLGQDPDDARQLFELIMAQSRAAQERARTASEDGP
jgi:chorismate mutase